MGTEVLRPHDCLTRVRHHAHAHAHAGSRRSPRPAARRRRGTARRAQAASPLPQEVRVKVSPATADAAYAGPAFGVMSPSPRALPLPRFSNTKTAAPATVEDSATRELRRLLGLERPAN
ncbi:hypothetical protein CFC21_002634 [Triticum aestivum]|uniref:Uncharacterized protein n=2 Tax=Triticum TaxID=4564 RepID=A0A9R0QC47_TRITD|nr:uncharacterized protein LOC119301777 [Triticum dicoccoides]XP_044420766.1 uncharacterized protein LOC123145397 [Triticum aestivum]XP_048554257.1 uncharacterized protein LOC125535249 [Triticum urartu]KAF6984666.1 hypothetical protein CFC21_002634 [Triticum aestivum]VAH07276.1 unnamed protein product [Triticum turgidum subsp. durum]